MFKKYLSLFTAVLCVIALTSACGKPKDRATQITPASSGYNPRSGGQDTGGANLNGSSEKFIQELLINNNLFKKDLLMTVR